MNYGVIEHRGTRALPLYKKDTPVPLKTVLEGYIYFREVEKTGRTPAAIAGVLNMADHYVSKALGISRG